MPATNSCQYQPLFNKGLRSNYDHHLLDPDRFLRQLRSDRQYVQLQSGPAAVFDACIENYTKFNDYTSGDDEKIGVEFHSPFEELEYIVTVNINLSLALEALINIRKSILFPMNEGDYNYDDNLTRFFEMLENKDGHFPLFLFLNFNEKFKEFLSKKVDNVINLNVIPDTLEEDEKNAQALLVEINQYRQELSALNFKENLSFIFDADETKLLKYISSLKRSKVGLKMATQVIEHIGNLLKNPDVLPYLENYLDIIESQKELADIFSKESDKQKLAVAFATYKKEIEANRKRAPNPPPTLTENESAQQKLIVDYLSKHMAAFTYKAFKDTLIKTNPLLDYAIFLEFRSLRAKLSIIQDFEKFRGRMKLDCESVYENHLGWEIGTLLHNLCKTEGEIHSFPENERAKPLYTPIVELQKHAEKLLNSNKAIDKAYGQITLDFANEIAITAHEFFDNSKKVGDKAAQIAFQKHFTKLLGSKAALMSEHRYKSGKIKKILSDIMKGLILVCSILGMPLYAAITKKNPFRLFYHHGTKREDLLEKIKEKNVVVMKLS